MVTPQHLLDIVMVPVATRATNITNISYWEIVPKSLVYIDQRILLNYYTFMHGKQFKIESSDYFQMFVYIQNFDVYLIDRYCTVWSITSVFPEAQLFQFFF